MSIFERKKKEENNAAACCCNCGAAEGKPAEAGGCCPEGENGVCCVKVLGAGCKSCHELLKNTQEAVAKLKLPVEVEYITDIQRIIGYGVTGMPALVVNERVAAMGKVLSAAEVQSLLEKY